MISKGSLLVLVHFVINIALPSQAQQRQQSKEVNLTRSLLQDYVTSARPVVKDSTVINVTLDIAFNHLLEIDKEQQVMTGSVWLRVGWVDEYLTWNATELGINSIVLAPEDIWRPDITLINNAHDEVNTIPVDKNIRVNSNGSVTWLQSSISKSQCTLLTLYFPFDIQTCKLIFSSWSYDKTQLDFFPKNNMGDSSEFLPNGVWELENIPVRKQQVFYTCCPEPFTTITYYVVLQRLSLYFVINLYVPCVLISFVSLMVFYLPGDAGEKTSFAVTMLLALTVFMLVAADNLPHSSSYIPIISQYLTGTILLLGLMVLTTVIILQIHHRGDYGSPPPNWLKILTFTYLARLMCISIFEPRQRKKSSYSLAPKPDSQGIQPADRFSSFQHTRSSDSILTRSSLNTQLGKTNTAASLSEEMTGDNRSDDQITGITATKNTAPKPQMDYIILSQMNSYLMKEAENAAIKEEWHSIAGVLDRFFLIVYFVAATALNAFPFIQYVIADAHPNVIPPGDDS